MADGEKFVLVADGGDIARAAELRRIKALATLGVAGCVALLILARVMERVHPAFGFVAAFAEAATIGGLADWYAVSRCSGGRSGCRSRHRDHPAQPAPHRRQARRVHRGAFPQPRAGGSEAARGGFASFVADWLRDAKKSTDLARFVLRLLPEALAAVETSGLRSLLIRRVVAQLQAIDLAPLAAGTLRGFIAEGRHRGMLDDLLLALHELLHKPETLAALRQKIRDELPTLLRLYQADRFLLNKIAASATAFLEDVRTNSDHPFRGEFDRILLELADKLAGEPAYAARIDGLKRDLLARPELAALMREMWANVGAFVDANARGDSEVLQRHLAGMFGKAGAQLASDAEMRAEINRGVAAVLRAFIAEQKSGVSRFIADQVKAWDMKQLINLIEINIGRDLQYIRFNGMVIGGLAGSGCTAPRFF